MGKQEYYHTKEDDIFSSWVTIIILKELINKILKQIVIFCKLCHLKPLSILKIAVKFLFLCSISNIFFKYNLYVE